MKKLLIFITCFCYWNSLLVGQSEIATIKNLFPLEDYLIDDQHSYIGFKIKYFGFSPVRGRFNQFNGHILYDETDISKTSVVLFVEVSSINTGQEMRDGDLKTSHWFDTEQFPKIKFESKKVIPKTTGFQVIGEMTMKGISKEITVDFEPSTAVSKDFFGNDQVDFSGQFVLKRSDFGITGEGFWNSLMDGGLKQLSDEVQIELDIHCRRPDYAIRKKDLEADNIRKIILTEFKEKGRRGGIKLLEHYKSNGTKADKTNISNGVLRTIGYVLLEDGKTEAALAVFQKKAIWFQDSNTVNVDLAKVYAKMGNQEKTAFYLEKAKERDVYNTLAILLGKQF